MAGPARRRPRRRTHPALPSRATRRRAGRAAGSRRRTARRPAPTARPRCRRGSRTAAPARRRAACRRPACRAPGAAPRRRRRLRPAARRRPSPDRATGPRRRTPAARQARRAARCRRREDRWHPSPRLSAPRGLQWDERIPAVNLYDEAATAALLPHDRLVEAVRRAMRERWSPEPLRIVGRTPAAADAFVDALHADGIAARAGAVTDVEVVVCLTTSRQPVLPDTLPPPVLVVGVGAFTPQMAEIPP